MISSNSLGVFVLQILVVGSCGKRKRATTPNEPSCDDLASGKSILAWRKRFWDLSVAARNMYTGNQSREIVKAVDLLRSIEAVDVELVIVSAGFGLVLENEPITPYNCSFSTMKKSEIVSRSIMLGINTDLCRVASKGFDLMYLALGKKYLYAIGRGWEQSVRGPIVCFDSRVVLEGCIHIPSDFRAVNRFSAKGYKIHGVAGFKGDLLRILAEYATSQEFPYTEVQSWSDPAYLHSLIMTLGSLSYLMS